MIKFRIKIFRPTLKFETFCPHMQVLQNCAKKNLYVPFPKIKFEYFLKSALEKMKSKELCREKIT